MNRKVALIWGVTGMDGSHLADLLLGEAFEVYGVSRRTSTPNTDRVAHLSGNPLFKLIPGDITDAGSVHRAINQAWATQEPEEFLLFNLAAQSQVRVSFEEPAHTTGVTYGGALNVLEALRQYPYLGKRARLYQASSSEMFGDSVSTRFLENTKEFYQDEQTPFHPRSPYAVAKLAAHYLAGIYRESYGLFACCGILFNHEGNRRGPEFVTRKITKYVARLVAYEMLGKPHPGKLKLGNLDAKRDWGAAPDYVRSFLMMLRHEEPDDYVIATGEAHSVREFLAAAWEAAHLVGDPMNSVEVDPSLYRPCEVPFLLGDASKARRVLGWAPQMTFRELVHWMVEEDIRAEMEVGFRG